MLPERVKKFVIENHRAVLTTFRRNGAAQMSIVTTGAYSDGAAFTTTEDRAKLANLKRDPRCSLLVSHESWWGYVVLEGRARVMAPDNTDAEVLRHWPSGTSTGPRRARSIPTGTSTTGPWWTTAARRSSSCRSTSTAPRM